ncbi:MAG: putative 4-hydroxybenzoate polyprenyltransferase [Phycisphaerales bacterium]|nr:putative 4-hydroxybenzoate polyprenyltransferase [Phycisphaerales bacterium]
MTGASTAQRGVIGQVRLAASDIKLSHSVFALPFAVLAAFLARPSGMLWGRFAWAMVLVVGCMVTARTWAMLVNRLVDRRIDAANPRTASRAVASGELAVGWAWAMALGCAALFVVLTLGFYLLLANPWPILLSVPVLAWIGFYSLSKRFTWLCHILLGGALACSPAAAAIAIEPASVGSAWAWLLAGMVLCWVAGFDIIYALQDVTFDRQAGLFSAPARMGVGPALWLSRSLHAGALGFLIALGMMEPRLSWLYGSATAIVAVLLICEHVLIATSGMKRLAMAFFTLNGVVSCVLGAAGVADIIVL